MNLNLIPMSVTINNHAFWAGVYTYMQGDEGAWCWYKNKDRSSQCLYAIPPDKAKLNYAPHVTISTLPHETGPGNSWVGFHVSIPLPDAGANARFNYSIAGGTSKFSNITRKGHTEANLDMVDRIAQLYREIDAFAQGFASAAWR